MGVEVLGRTAKKCLIRICFYSVWVTLRIPIRRTPMIRGCWMFRIRSFYSCLLCFILVLYKCYLSGKGTNGMLVKNFEFIPERYQCRRGSRILFTPERKIWLKNDSFFHVSSRATKNETLNAENVGARPKSETYTLSERTGIPVCFVWESYPRDWFFF